MDYGSLLNDSDPQTLKGQVSLAAVVMAHDVELTVAGERLVGLCPFHDDHDASFAIWKLDDGTELCGCWSCDFRPGDVYDFLRRKRGVSFTEAVRLVAEYAKGGLPTAPAIPERVIDPEAPERFRAAVRETEGKSLATLAELLLDKNHPATAEWVAAEFKVGVRRHEILIPHYGPNGELDAAKWRTLDRKPVAFPGSNLVALYGAWRDLGRQDVVLCEGESDTWAVAYLLRDSDVDVLGLPSGVSQKPKPEWVAQLKGRNVTLLFDGDDAGCRAAAQWIGALATQADIRVAMLPEGEDAVSAGPTATVAALTRAWPYVDPGNLPISRTPIGYQKFSPDGEKSTVLSNFVMNVRRVIIGEDGGATFEVAIAGRGPQTYQLPESILVDPNRFKKWAAHEFLGAWKGGNRDVVELMELVVAEAILCPRLRGTTIAGLHDDTFVLPDGTIGSRGWGFLQAGIDWNLGKNIRLTEPARWSPEALLGLRDLHATGVITPLLGWTAAAPLRSLVPQFPIFACVGGAGWGKTTVVQTVLDAFGLWTGQPMTLTSTTPFALTAMVGSTNALPVWVDEYRGGARKDSKLVLDQIIRDAWDGSSGYKGSVKEGGGMELSSYTAIAPLLITGEDGFSETSHAERMVIVPIPRDGRNADALALVRRSATDGLGHAYLRWLVDRINDDTIPHWPEVSSRHEQAMAVVSWGWSLLHQFAAEAGVEMGQLDLSVVDREFQSMSNSSPYEEALKEGLGQLADDGRPIVWIDGNDLCVRIQPLAKYVHTKTDIVLPGSSRAMKSYYTERWGAKEDRTADIRYLRVFGAASSTG